MMDAKLVKAVRAASDARLIEIALEFAERYPNEFARALGLGAQTFVAQRTDGGREAVTLTDAQIAEVEAAGARSTAYGSGKIYAIKTLRELSGCSLWLAKTLVEQHGWYR